MFSLTSSLIHSQSLPPVLFLLAMNEYYREDKPYCYFHPKEIYIGVCPLCLNERLLILAAKQGVPLPKTHTTTANKHKKIFALGSLLNFFEFQHKTQFHNCDSDHDDASAGSQENSFISIKFGNNGVASWEKGKVSKVSLDHCSISWNQSSIKEAKSSVVEHGKPRRALRWRKQIGHLFQLSRWRRSTRGSVCHVGCSKKLEGVKVRSWWIRALTKRRAKE